MAHEEEKTFQMKFHETAMGLKHRPLADRLAVLVKIGVLTEKGRQRALTKDAAGRKGTRSRVTRSPAKRRAALKTPTAR